MKKHINVSITGHVQGVSYRDSTKAVADHLGVKGIIKNQPDGTVYLEAEGDSFALDALIEWCKEGPERSVVDSVEAYPGEWKDYKNFNVVKR